ncbi:MAG: DUF5908 family protein [Chitinophagaceae bacterium]
MPVEVRELVIKVTVVEEKKNMELSRELQDIKDNLVKECIEKIMTKLEALPER